MKLRFFLFLMLISLNTFASESNCEEIIDRTTAIFLAQKHLTKLKIQDKVLYPVSHITENYCSWVVWFKVKDWKNVKPSRKAVLIDISSGEAKLLPAM